MLLMNKNRIHNNHIDLHVRKSQYKHRKQSVKNVAKCAK